MCACDRYMAPELLNFSVERFTASDMFSFGLTIFELCMIPSQASELPSSGPSWLDLREGRVPSISTEFCERPTALSELILSCLAPEPKTRSTASACLLFPEIFAAGNRAKEFSDELLMSAPIRNPTTNVITRSASYLPSMAMIDVNLPPLSLDERDLKTPTHNNDLDFSVNPFYAYNNVNKTKNG
jgi:serine/threonine protein kinase